MSIVSWVDRRVRFEFDLPTMHETFTQEYEHGDGTCTVIGENDYEKLD